MRQYRGPNGEDRIWFEPFAGEVSHELRLLEGAWVLSSPRPWSQWLLGTQTRSADGISSTQISTSQWLLGTLQAETPECAVEAHRELDVVAMVARHPSSRDHTVSSHPSPGVPAPRRNGCSAPFKPRRAETSLLVTPCVTSGVSGLGVEMSHLHRSSRTYYARWGKDSRSIHAEADSANEALVNLLHELEEVISDPTTR